jgi:RNase P protein component
MARETFRLFYPSLPIQDYLVAFRDSALELERKELRRELERAFARLENK